jgi:hypothetical protein
MTPDCRTARGGQNLVNRGQNLSMSLRMNFILEERSFEIGALRFSRRHVTPHKRIIAFFAGAHETRARPETRTNRLIL